MPEPRLAVMILVDAFWHDADGAVHSARARMLDKSSGGACVQVPRQIEVGTRLILRGRWDHFGGVVKHCHREGTTYLVGLQRDTESPELSASPAPASERNSTPIASPAQPLDQAAVLRTSPILAFTRPGILKPESQPTTRHSQPPEIAASHPHPTPSKPNTAPSKEGKTMRNRWLELTGRTSKSEHASAETAPTLPPKPAVHTVPVLSQPATTFQVELLPVDEIYRSAGIATPRRGYGIAKVIEMIQSEHIRALAPELKRAAVLMALHAAGVSIGEVVTDAKARQEILSAYEIERKKLIESEWQRKAEENAQIEAELELVKAQYQARMKRNLEAVEREKGSFAAWLEKKQQECKNMSDAVDLCLQNPAADAAPATPQAAAATAAT